MNFSLIVYPEDKVQLTTHAFKPSVGWISPLFSHLDKFWNKFESKLYIKSSWWVLEEKTYFKVGCLYNTMLLGSGLLGKEQYLQMMFQITLLKEECMYSP